VGKGGGDETRRCVGRARGIGVVGEGVNYPLLYPRFVCSTVALYQRQPIRLVVVERGALA
jgi:hypothetical protein